MRFEAYVMAECSEVFSGNQLHKYAVMIWRFGGCPCLHRHGGCTLTCLRDVDFVSEMLGCNSVPVCLIAQEGFIA